MTVYLVEKNTMPCQGYISCNFSYEVNWASTWPTPYMIDDENRLKIIFKELYAG